MVLIELVLIAFVRNLRDVGYKTNGRTRYDSKKFLGNSVTEE